jgi:hypothetical protein
MVDAEPTSLPYPSLDALRQGNEELLDSLPDDESHLSPEDRRANAARINDFVQKAVASGAVLDVPADRRAAQGMIDYWMASAYAPSSSSTSGAPVARADVTLKPFDAGLLGAIAKRGEEAVAAAGQKQQDLARRLLLRLLRLGNSGTFTLSPATRDALLTLGDPQTVDKILGQLIGAGVVARTPGPQGDLFELRYEALVRQWDRLRNWAEERAKFRDAAQFWDHSGRNKGALLASALAYRAAAYHDLDSLEASFVVTSTSHGGQRLLVLAFLAGLLVAAVIIAYPYVNDYRVAREAQYLVDRLASGGLSQRETEEAIRWLASHQQRLDFSAADLDGPLDLSGIQPAPSLFTDTFIENVKFDGADLSYVAFNQATVSNTSFKNTTLKWARFDGAAIDTSSFSGANLYRSIFDGSRLDDVDFSRADIRSASFRNVIVDPSNFTETDWWLAFGWSLTQIDEFADQYPNDRYQQTEAFKNERKIQMEKIAKNKSMSELEAIAQDDLAWLHATYGIDLDAGEAASKRAMHILDSLVGKADPKWIEKNNFSFKDTFAYLLMQKGRMQEALPLLKFLVEEAQEGGMMFRYAVTVHALAGEKAGSEKETLERDALTHLTEALGKKNYTPSHELYLLRKYITGELRAKLQKFVGPHVQ